MARHSRMLPVLLLWVALSNWAPKLHADAWQPISNEELAMTAEPKAPGAPAICLYRQVDRDDGRTPHEYNYFRIKIFTEEGRKYGNIEIPYLKERGKVSSIKARVVQTDGRIVAFDGTVYDKTLVKMRGVKYLAKSFTLPDVRVGSIIEYYYTLELDERFVFDSQWILSSELFTKKAHFSLKKSPTYAMRWSWPRGLPGGTSNPQEHNGLVTLDTQDIPAFTTEEYMPPENELKYRVDFVYVTGAMEQDEARFWKREGKRQYDIFESFTNKRKAMEQAASEIVSAGDSPETKLQKIYTRVQQIRNRSFERERSEQELKRDKEKEVNNVEDVWKRGVGNGRQIDWLFIALARAAGLEAYSVLVPTRDTHLLHRALMNAIELNSDVVLVKLNGKNLFYDPGTAFAPFGLLPWRETAVQGLRLDKDGGDWIDVSLPGSAASRIERTADLKLSQDGSLEGTLTVTYSGLEALWLRMDERDEDDASHKQVLEDLLRESVPVGIDVSLINKPDWNSSSPTLVAQYKLTVPGWVSGAGRRALLPLGLFSSGEKHMFEHGNRIHPIYFHFPYQKIDSINITLPLGWTADTMPKAFDRDVKALAFDCKAENDNGTLHIERKLRSDLLVVPQKDYPLLHDFYQSVRTSDEQQIMLQPGR